MNFIVYDTRFTAFGVVCQPGLAGGQLLEREPLSAAVFQAGDALLDPGVEADAGVVCCCRVKVWSVQWPSSGIRRRNKLR